jgi:hypothetical protein
MFQSFMTIMRFKQNVSVFITKLHDTMDPLLIVLSYKKVLHKITMFKYTKILVMR